MSSFLRYLLPLFFFYTPIQAHQESLLEKNYILPCSHGVEMLEQVLACIQEAEQTLEFSLCFGGSGVFHKIMKAIEKRMEEVADLQVFILSATTLLTDKEFRVMEELKAKFQDQFHYAYTLHIVEALPEVITIDYHVKGIIVDEKYYSIGGSNFDDVLISEGTFTPKDPGYEGARANLPLGNRDQDVIGSGPIAKELRIYFHQQFALWEHYIKNVDNFIYDPTFFKDKNHYQPIDPQKKRAYLPSFENSAKKCTTDSVRLIVTGPEQEENKIVKEYVHLLEQAKSQVTIGNLYFNPPEPIFEAVRQAVKRGVDFTLITNGLYDNSPFFCPFIAWANRINYLPLLHGREYNFWEAHEAEKDPFFENIHLLEYHVGKIMYHKKTMLVDNKYAVIGSFNLGERSLSCDYEAILVIDSEEVAQHFSNIYAEDKRYSERITHAQCFDWYFNPVIRYLASLQKQFHAFF